MIIRKGGLDDLLELQQLFVGTISSVCHGDYDTKQIHAWAGTIERKQRWQEVLTNQFVLVAQDLDKIAGFCTLDHGNYIDLLYVHKDYQRQGIAYHLYAEIEKEARRQGQTSLTSDVSITARAFFERVGFKIIKEQAVSLEGIELTNYKMIKEI